MQPRCIGVGEDVNDARAFPYFVSVDGHDSAAGDRGLGNATVSAPGNPEFGGVARLSCDLGDAVYARAGGTDADGQSGRTHGVTPVRSESVCTVAAVMRLIL